MDQKRDANRGTWSFVGAATACALGAAVAFADEGKEATTAIAQSGATERSPSKSMYFAWVNSGLEGSTEKQTLANLDFFMWLHDEYGMVLDVYTLDAGVIDGCNYYGSVDSARFKERFPAGFGPLAEKAAAMGTRLGIWAGPDGFGDTPEEEDKRIRQMVDLCRKHHFIHFKFDGYCSPLRKGKAGAFIDMVKACRTYSPDLIVQNHCLDLYEAQPYATTTFWGGKEMYIDVLLANRVCAPHHRAEAMARGLVEGMTRLHEDHGTCLSSCLDGWDDEMILCSFGRNLILSPEMYGSPWLLSDSEFPKLARIFNLNRKYGGLLVNGKPLPASYGPSAVSRGDAKQRFVVLRNLNWEETSYTISLDDEIGLEPGPGQTVELRQFHPTEKQLGIYPYGEKVVVTVQPFRACLLYAGTTVSDEPGLAGTDYQVLRKVPGKPVEIDILGLPGTSATVRLLGADGYTSAKLDGADASPLLNGSLEMRFPGEPLKRSCHRKLADMQLAETPVDSDANALYEATVFAADNNALEVRSLLRSGWSTIPAVRTAQEALLKGHEFITHGAWDKNLFDNKADTGFWPTTRISGVDMTIDGGCFRLDLGAVCDVDELVLDAGDEFGLEPLWKYTGYSAYVSEDLVAWRPVTFAADVVSRIPVNGRMRYLKLPGMPQRLVSVEAFKNRMSLPRDTWRASNLFRNNVRKVKQTWRADFTLDEIPEQSYLCVAINGTHGEEGAYAAAKIGGVYAGFPDRAPSYRSNTWGYFVAAADRNYTYYLPLTDSAKGKPIEIYVLASDGVDLKPEVWITARQPPYVKKRLALSR